MFTAESQVKTKTTLKPDSYFLHRTSLRPLLPGAGEKDLIESCQQIYQIGETRFMNFLHQQDLAPMWSKGDFVLTG